MSRSSEAVIDWKSAKTSRCEGERDSIRSAMMLGCRRVSYSLVVVNVRRRGDEAGAREPIRISQLGLDSDSDESEADARLYCEV